MTCTRSRKWWCHCNICSVTPRRIKGFWISLSPEMKRGNCSSLQNPSNRARCGNILVRLSLSVGKLMLTVFWNRQGPLLLISCHEVTPSRRTDIVAHLHICVLPSGKSARRFSWTWFSSMTKPGFIWQTRPPSNCSHSDGRLWSIHRIVQTSLPVITTCLVHWRSFWQAESSFLTTTWRPLSSRILQEQHLQISGAMRQMPELWWWLCGKMVKGP